MAYGTQRDAPPPVAFAPVSARYASEQGSCEECTILLKDPLGDVSEIQIALHAPQDLGILARSAAITASQEGSDAWWKLMATYPGRTHDQGYFATIEDGKRLIELARRTVDIPGVEALLAQAGFRYEHTVPTGAKFYRRDAGRGAMFTIVLTGTSVHLAFERDGEGGFRNLMRLATALEGHNTTIPCFWPTYLQSPAMHVLLACTLADEYAAAGRTARLPRRKRARA